MLTVLVPPPEYWLGPDAILVHDLYTKKFVGNSIIVIHNYYTLYLLPTLQIAERS
jgi:hypothetical protein